MEAPDNIYLWETLIVNGGYDPAWHKNSFNEGDVEYIRKDALLEWLEQEVLKLDVRSDNDAVAWGQRNAFKQVIDILNSM